jgi:hypothetical protein
MLLGVGFMAFFSTFRRILEVFRPQVTHEPSDEDKDLVRSAQRSALPFAPPPRAAPPSRGHAGQVIVFRNKRWSAKQRTRLDDILGSELAATLTSPRLLRRFVLKELERLGVILTKLDSSFWDDAAAGKAAGATTEPAADAAAAEAEEKKEKDRPKVATAPATTAVVDDEDDRAEGCEVFSVMVPFEHLATEAERLEVLSQPP